MNYLHQQFQAGSDDVIEVTLDHPANVLLLDDDNYRRYQAGGSYRYHGGYARQSPARLSPPREGHWHLVVDLGGLPGSVQAGARLIHGAHAHV